MDDISKNEMSLKHYKFTQAALRRFHHFFPSVWYWPLFGFLVKLNNFRRHGCEEEHSLHISTAFSLFHFLSFPDFHFWTLFHFSSRKVYDDLVRNSFLAHAFFLYYPQQLTLCKIKYFLSVFSLALQNPTFEPICLRYCTEYYVYPSPFLTLSSSHLSHYAVHPTWNPKQRP